MEDEQRVVEEFSETYKTIDDHNLAVHIFKPENGAMQECPAFVFFFGGGWRGGTPMQFFPQCRYFASRSLVALSAEYRVALLHHTSPFESVADAKSMLRWVRSNAQRLGIDPSRIIAGGGSAGGHLATCTAFDLGSEDAGEDVSISCVPNALVLFNPPLDLLAVTPPDALRQEFGEGIAEISPMSYITSGAPPTIILHGTADTVVSIEGVRRFRDAMVAAGNRCDLVEYEGAEHEFFNYSFPDAFVATVRATDEFLGSLGLVRGPPTIDSIPVESLGKGLPASAS